MKNKGILIFILIFLFVIFINMVPAQSFGNIFGFYEFNSNTLFLNHPGLPSGFNIQNNKIIPLNPPNNKNNREVIVKPVLLNTGWGNEIVNSLKGINYPENNLGIIKVSSSLIKSSSKKSESSKSSEDNLISEKISVGNENEIAKSTGGGSDINVAKEAKIAENVSKSAQVEKEGSCKRYSKETNEGPGGDYCAYDDYEECYNYLVRSTVYAYNCNLIPEIKCFVEESGTDYCSSNSILQEAYLNCGWSNLATDNLEWKEKDCNDYDFYRDWEYYCEGDYVMEKRPFLDYGCNEGECDWIETTWESYYISKKGDDDYCIKRKKYTEEGAPGCSLCGYGDYDCDLDNECSGDLKCKGPVGGAFDGCCYANEEWDTIKKECVEIECRKNSDCGTEGYTNICETDDEYQRYISYTCHNPGKISSYCISSTSDTKIKECGTSGYTGNNYCYAGDIYQDYVEKGCSGSSCYSNTEKKEIGDCNHGCENGKCKPKPAECSTGQTKCEGTIYYECSDNNWVNNGNVVGKCKVECLNGDKCAGTTYYLCQDYKWKSQGNVEGKCGYKKCTLHYSEKCYDNDIYWYDSCEDKEDKKLECGISGCSNNKCNAGNIICSKNSDCGTDGYMGNAFCSGNNVNQNYITYTCSNPGITSSSCSNLTISKKKEECGTAGCSNNKCNIITEKSDLTVTDLKIQSISGKNVVLGFTIKNIGTSTASNIYWKINTGSSVADIKRTNPITLQEGNFTRAYMTWTYLSSGTYKPKVIVDYSNLIKESNEGNNEKSISVTI